MTTRVAEPVRRAPFSVALVTALAGVVLGGLTTALFSPYAVADPGALVRWGLPVTTAIRDVAMSATTGLLVLAAFIVPERVTTDRRGLARRLATWTALLWAVAGLLVVVLTFSDLSGTRPGAAGFWSELSSFIWSLETTRIYLLSALAGLVVALGAPLARGRAATAWLVAVCLVGASILALTGHSAGAVDHETAVNALGVHLLSITVWVGGLLGLAALRPVLGVDLGACVGRFSVLALWCYVAVAVSGIQQAWIRLGSISGLATAYGALIVAKSVALIALGILGWRQRESLRRRLTADPSDGRAFARLALSEAGFMGAAIGVAVALARSAPPVPETVSDASRVFALTTFPDPGPMRWSDWFFAWRMDWLMLAIALTAIGLYLAGVVVLRRRGDAWSLGRTICWTLGWLVFVWATCGGPGIWGRILFSVHMVMHMSIAMIVPLLLVPAAPVTLALRTLSARHDKTWGPREVILQVVHSRALAVISNPIVAAVLFFLSLALFYFTPLFELALRTHTGHLLMLAHFLLTGYLFVNVLIGVDPGPKRWSPLLLLIILFATVSFHAFFGVVITGSQTLLAPDFFQTLQLPWMTNPMADQVTAGEIAWGVGELPTLILALLVAQRWVRADRAEAERSDRQAARDGDAELAAYNAMLAERRAQYRQKGD
ncbi:conserved membrane hypothetical protein [Nostocoides japonicum T1-X7]|uniref:Copper resistance protein D domain-containing protein n=1 Tax=Nostocoides japonicum T1-X7 TaxID=1194083 RepID=A0A077M2D5_9MICO|nr:cytochrome c oxidase assembly protein [Tetrasphaera japonica]CCH79991.1 conserved membrane hypothetical protein [Tetrasphaera japonica T1-X7]